MNWSGILELLEKPSVRQAIIVIITIPLSFILTRILRFALQKYFEKSSVTLKVDPTNYRFLVNAISFIVFMLAIMVIFYFIPPLHKIGVSLFASAGILAAIIGFASQKAFANIISGVFIVIFKPFRVGDFIKISEEHMGWVEDITLRHSVIRNFENRRIVIPNASISEETIMNSTINDPKIKNMLNIGISYDSDVEKAIAIIQDEAKNHPNWIDGRNRQEKKNNMPEVEVVVVELNDFSQDLRAFVWTENHIKGFYLKSDLRISIKKRFDAEGIEIPFPYRTIVYKKDIESGKNKARQVSPKQ